MTIKCFKKFCLKVGTDQSDKIHDYYIKMENINNKYIKNKLQKQQEEIKQLKDKINITYEEIERNEFIYIISIGGKVYKIGFTKDTKTRIKQLQTAHNEEIILEAKYATYNGKIIESVIHDILDRYRTNANREFFRCSLDYLKNICQITVNYYNTLKSTYENITNEELNEKIKEKINCV